MRTKGFELTVNSTSKSMVTITVASKLPPNDQPSGLSKMAQEQTFLIHKDFICYYSKFFDAAFNGQFEEGQTQAMTLDDIDPDAFGLLVDWLYTQRVDVDGNSLPTLERLWIMGDRFLIPAIQNSAMDCIHGALVAESGSVERFREYVRLANDFNGGENLLVYVVIRMFCATGQKHYDLLVPEIPPEMLLKLALPLKKHHEGCSLTTQIKMGDSKHFYV
jgi:hypothetical protein